MAVVSPLQRVIRVFFDVDGTLIDFEASQNAAVRWTSGSAALWQRLCRALIILGKRQGFSVKFGLCSFKEDFDPLIQAVLGKLCQVAPKEIREKGIDDLGLSEYLFEQEEIKEIDDLTKEAFPLFYSKYRLTHILSQKNSPLEKSYGISDFIEEELRQTKSRTTKVIQDFKKFGIYCTSFQPKQNALMEVAQSYGVEDRQNIWIIDDSSAVCDSCKAHQFTTFHADVVQFDKAQELNNVKCLIDRILTKANNDVSITLEELVPEIPLRMAIQADLKKEAEMQAAHAMGVQSTATGVEKKRHPLKGWR